MSRFKRTVAVLLLLGFALSLCGCWDKKEFNKISLVSAMAVDKAEDGYELTVQIMMPKNLQEGGENSPTWILQGKGDTLQSAVDDINARSPRRINWGHMNVVILGEGALQENVHRSLDFFVRGREFRRRNYFVAAEGKASEILKAAPELAELNTFYLSSIIEDQEQRVAGSAVTLNDMMLGINTLGRDLYLPKIQLVDNDTTGGGGESSGGEPAKQTGASSEGGGEQGQDGQKSDSTKKLLELSGGALIGDNHLLGWEDAQWQNGFYWVKGRINDGSITLSNPVATPEDLIVMNIRNSQGRISLLKEEPLTMKIQVEATLKIAEDTRRDIINQINGTTDDQHKIEESFNQLVKEHIQKTLQESQRMNADVFGFGQYLTAYHPDIANQLDWENYFKTMQFEIEVKGKLKPSSIIN